MLWIHSIVQLKHQNCSILLSSGPNRLKGGCVNKIYCAIQSLEIYPVDSAIHPKNNRSLVYKLGKLVFFNKCSLLDALYLNTVIRPFSCSLFSLHLWGAPITTIENTLVQKGSQIRRDETWTSKEQVSASSSEYQF